MSLRKKLTKKLTWLCVVVVMVSVVAVQAALPPSFTPARSAPAVTTLAALHFDAPIALNGDDCPFPGGNGCG